MKIFGFIITRDEKKPSFWTHLAIVFTKSGKTNFYVNGKFLLLKNHTIDFWVNNEKIAQLDNVNYVKNIIKKGERNE